MNSIVLYLAVNIQMNKSHIHKKHTTTPLTHLPNSNFYASSFNLMIQMTVSNNVIAAFFACFNQK